MRLPIYCQYPNLIVESEIIQINGCDISVPYFPIYSKLDLPVITMTTHEWLREMHQSPEGQITTKHTNLNLKWSNPPPSTAAQIRFINQLGGEHMTARIDPTIDRGSCLIGP